MLGSTIKRELAAMILHDLTDPRLVGLPSITRVKVSPDLATADVYVTVMGTPGQQTAALHALQHSAGLMRSKLTRAVSLRIAPFLRFQLDENLRKEMAVLDLIRLANREREEREQAAADPDADAADGQGDDRPTATENEDHPAAEPADRE